MSNMHVINKKKNIKANKPDPKVPKMHSFKGNHKKCQIMQKTFLILTL